MTTGPIPAGTVTVADLFAAVIGTRQDVQAVLTKVEVISVQHATLAGQLADHETRIRQITAALPARADERLAALERWRWKLGGGIALLAILTGILGGWIATVSPHR